jgi:hypothetical protein
VSDVQTRAATPAAKGSGHKLPWRPTTQQINEAGLAAALIVLVLVLSATADHFAGVANLWAILGDAALVGIVAWAGTLVIVAGEIDLSVGPAFAFWSVIRAKLNSTWSVPLWLAVILTLAGGALVGAFAGWLRARFGVPSFIVTLGLWSALRGLAQFMTNALPIPIRDNGFLDLLRGGRHVAQRRQRLAARHAAGRPVHHRDRQRTGHPRRQLLHPGRGAGRSHRHRRGHQHDPAAPRRREIVGAGRARRGDIAASLAGCARPGRVRPPLHHDLADAERQQRPRPAALGRRLAYDAFTAARPPTRKA